MHSKRALVGTTERLHKILFVEDDVDIHEIIQIAELSRAHCIFMTAKVQTDKVNHLLSLGVIGTIQKLFDQIRLPSQLTSMWDK